LECCLESGKFVDNQSTRCLYSASHAATPSTASLGLFRGGSENESNARFKQAQLRGTCTATTRRGFDGTLSTTSLTGDGSVATCGEAVAAASFSVEPACPVTVAACASAPCDGTAATAGVGRSARVLCERPAGAVAGAGEDETGGAEIEALLGTWVWTEISSGLKATAAVGWACGDCVEAA